MNSNTRFPARTRRQYLLVSAVAAGALLASAGALAVAGQARPDHSQLPDAERDALYQQWRREGVDIQRNYLAEFERARQDPRKLERAEIHALVDASAAATSFANAVQRSEVVVRGRVERVGYAFDATGAAYTVAHLSVEQTLKGEAREGLVVEIPGAPELILSAGRSREYLGYLPPLPPLFKGDRVLLMLTSTPGDTYAIQPFTGQYFVDGARARVPDSGNPFRAGIHGRPVAEVLAEARAAAR